MARKRGGLAGLYDRNKGVIQAAAPFIAGAVGGPLAGAAVGAAMKGLDREGKSGIGLDLGQAAMGGLSGYASGALGKSVSGGLKGRLAEIFTGGGAKLPPVDMASKIGITPGTMAGARAPLSVAPVSATGVSSTATPQVFSDALKRGADRGKALASRAAAFAEKNPTLVAGIAKGAMGDPAAELEAQKYRDEQERLQRRAGLAAGMFTGFPEANIMPESGMSAGDYLPSTTAMGETFPDDPRAIRAMEQGRTYMTAGYGGSPRAGQVARRAQAQGAAYRYPR